MWGRRPTQARGEGGAGGGLRDTQERSWGKEGTSSKGEGSKMRKGTKENDEMETKIKRETKKRGK